MFSQLKSMVASAVTQDPIYEYKVDDKSMFLCGRNEIFRVKDAVEISSGKEVSIFQVKIADLMARQDPAADTTYFLDRLRHHVALMLQLRHPGVLRVERGLVEAPNKKFWFVTERVKAWVPHLPLKQVPRQLRVLGLRRCAETLRFLHETADLLLVDFSPQALFVTTDGRWKIGDFIHAIRRTELMAESDAGVVSVLCTPSRSFRSVGAPLLDYVAAEFVDYLLRGGGAGGGSSSQPPAPSQPKGPSLDDFMKSGGGGGDLFFGPSSPSLPPQQQQTPAFNPSAPIEFPGSDIYSFLLTTAEILNGGKKLFNCAGSLDRHKALRCVVEKEVDAVFPRGALAHRPRPPIATVTQTGPFATPDMQLLGQIERYDTLDANDRFALLKALYSSLAPNPPLSALASSPGSGGGGLNDTFDLSELTRRTSDKTVEGEEKAGVFCEQVIIENVLPLMQRESKTQAMLRFVVPIMLQCCYALSQSMFEMHLREYFTALMHAMLKAKAPWYEKVGLLAQLMLERFDILSARFNTNKDKVEVLMPFVTKCLYTDANGDDDALLNSALVALRKLFESDGRTAAAVAVAALLPTNDAAAALAEKLIDVGATHPTLFTSAFLCLEKILVVASTSTKMTAETHLINALKSSYGVGSGSENNSGQLGHGSTFSSSTTTTEARRLQLASVLSTLQRLEDGFTREHAAAKSIPQLSQLLLSSNDTVCAFAVQAIDQHLRGFRSGTDKVGIGAVPAIAVGGAGPVTSSANTAADFFRRAPGTAASSDYGASHSAGNAYNPNRPPPNNNFSQSNSMPTLSTTPHGGSGGAVPAWTPTAVSLSSSAANGGGRAPHSETSPSQHDNNPNRNNDIFASLGLF